MKFKIGDIVKVKRILPVGKRNENDTAPQIGAVVYAHPRGIYYTVEFRDRYTENYKPMYRECFWPERLERVYRKNFFEPRPAQKRKYI